MYRVDLEKFTKMLDEVSHYKPICEEDILNIVNNIEKTLKWGEIIGFEYINSGSFKECYRLNDDFIIKFACIENYTEREQELLNYAKEEGVEDLFLPTWFCPLDYSDIELTNLDSDCCYSYYYNGERRYYTESANYIIIQPMVTNVAIDLVNRYCYNEKDYYKTPLINKNNKGIVNYHLFQHLIIHNMDWLQQLLDCYDINYLYKMKHFFNNYGVHDLHGGNIGYLNGRPVILDWLS